MRILELPEKLRARGLTVREVSGWQERGREFPSRPDGALRHWDAAQSKAPTAALGVITNGRSDLPGPLAQVYQSRYVDDNGLDIVYVVASGKANHAGRGEWNGISGNYKLLGLEIAWSGPSEEFGEKRVLTSELVMRALLDCCTGTNTNDTAEHREYAQPAGRKIDTNLDGNVLRQRMAELGETPEPVAPQPPAPGPDRLVANQQLKPGGIITSKNGKYSLSHQTDGNVVVYRHEPDINAVWSSVWSTRTFGFPTTTLALQGDGNLVLYSKSGALWHTGTDGEPNPVLVMQGDGNLVLYADGKPRWNSKGYSVE